MISIIQQQEVIISGDNAMIVEECNQLLNDLAGGNGKLFYHLFHSVTKTEG
ncbi:MAG: hypothetical protein ABI402_09330 [Ferruginibacter sp.]